MAKLKGGSVVYGDLVVVGALVAEQFATSGGAYQVFADPAIGTKQNYIPKFESDANYELVKSLITDNGTTVTINGNLIKSTFKYKSDLPIAFRIFILITFNG